MKLKIPSGGIIKCADTYRIWWEINWSMLGLPFSYCRVEELFSKDIETTYLIRIGPFCLAMSHLEKIKYKNLTIKDIFEAKKIIENMGK